MAEILTCQEMTCSVSSVKASFGSLANLFCKSWNQNGIINLWLETFNLFLALCYYCWFAITQFPPAIHSGSSNSLSILSLSMNSGKEFPWTNRSVHFVDSSIVTEESLFLLCASLHLFPIFRKVPTSIIFAYYFETYIDFGLQHMFIYTFFRAWIQFWFTIYTG